MADRSSRRPRRKGAAASDGQRRQLARASRLAAAPLAPATARASARVLCDGGSRGNPGPAAIAAVLFAPDGSLLDRRSSPIGRATAAEAEYRAILLGLELAATHGADPLELCSDSLLAIEAVQRAGAADVGLDAVAGAADAGLNARAGAADAGLEGLVRQIRAASRRFSAVSWRWHPARENEPADALVRELLWH